MSGTIMDTNPESSASALPDPAPLAASEQAAPDLPAPTFATLPRRENPLLAIFVGPNGLYPGTRWLMYLAMGGILMGVCGAILHFVRPAHGASIWWGLLSEGVVMAGAILPALLMARIEKRPFGAFGLPKQNAFRRNFWIGTLWGIVSLSALMIGLRIAGQQDRWREFERCRHRRHVRGMKQLPHGEPQDRPEELVGAHEGRL